MGNYKELNRFNVSVCEVFKYNIEDWERLQNIEGYKQLCERFSFTKLRFMECTTTIQKSFMTLLFSNALWYEIEFNTDMCLWSLDQFKNFIGKLIEDKKITSTIMYFSFYNVISKYTEWAYLNQYRKDYYITRDLTALYSVHEAVKNDNAVYTTKEIKEIIRNVERIDVQIALLCMLEGLKSSDIVSLYKSDFESKMNHSLILASGRIFKMSEELYSLCHKYCNMDYSTYKYRNGEYAKLNDGKYLLRTTRKTNVDKPYMSSQLATIIRNDLNAINVHVEARIFRTYAMVCDLCYGMNIEEINKKYNTKYNHPRNLYRSNDLLKQMQEKVKAEQEQA